MMLGSVHVQPSITVPLALALAAGLAWYWWRVGRRWKRAARRVVRRLSILLIALSLPALVRGLSFSNPFDEPQAYLVTWTVATMLVLAVLAVGSLDAVLTYRVHRREYEEALHRVRRELTEGASPSEKTGAGERGQP